MTDVQPVKSSFCAKEMHVSAMYTKVTGMTTDCMQQTPAKASSLHILVEEHTEHALLLGSQIMLEQKLLH